MDIRTLIVQILKRKGEIRASEIVERTGFSRAYVNRFFSALKDEGKIILLGRANQAHYILAVKKEIKNAKKQVLSIHRILRNKNLSEDIVLDEIKNATGIFIGLSNNVTNILDYAFTEMLNNAIEHSKSRSVDIKMERSKERIYFDIVDKGIGIFRDIMQKKYLNGEMEAIQDLVKGKLTTAPKTHTGEGIFFTSKAADILIIKSSHKKILFNNLIDEMFIEDIRPTKGTIVSFSIGLSVRKRLEEIFREYTDESFEFSKTKVKVALFKMGEEYISRSQARRILSGLANFKTIILDFKNVKTVGQAFSDEVFRVWKTNHPKINILPENANENVLFMIKRSSE